MLETILSKSNLLAASKHVVANAGSPGVDSMTVYELSKDVTRHINTLRKDAKEGTYQPRAILGVTIPKANGKTRLLGIPTVVDRLLQQAVSQVLSPKFETEFKEHSYGFRPNRNAHQAIQRAMKNIHDGFNRIIDIDLKNFFDEVDHGILLTLLHRKVRCPQTLKLIRQWLRAPMKINGQLTKRRKGIPQGSPLSPLLSNIMLHELDTELERRGHRYVRYADDFSIYVKSKASAQRVKAGVHDFLEKVLKLPINTEKSGIRKPNEFQILGHKVVRTHRKNGQAQYRLAVQSSKMDTLKRELRKITARRAPLSFDERVAKLRLLQRGWINYFCLAKLTKEVRQLDRWVRTRLRCCIWTDWKLPKRRGINLRRLGATRSNAFLWGKTRLGPWAVAQSPILQTTITIRRLESRGYESMTSYYERVAPQFNEPLYTRPVRTVV